MQPVYGIIMICNDPHVFAGILIGSAVGALALVPVVVSPTFSDRRRAEFVRIVAAGCSAIFLGLLAILLVTYLSGGIRLCR